MGKGPNKLVFSNYVLQKLLW